MADPEVNQPEASGEAEHDPQFEPVIKLTEQVAAKTHEEDEDVVFKMRAKLFRFAKAELEWKERGTGDVRLLAHKETKKIRLLMRRDQTLKVCANHVVTSDMKLAPNIGSDRSWVWNVAADYTEGEPSAETLAIRFSNSENANAFKKAFEDAQASNAGSSGAESTDAAAAEVKAEGTTESAEAAAPEPVNDASADAQKEAPKEDVEAVAPASEPSTHEPATTETATEAPTDAAAAEVKAEATTETAEAAAEKKDE
ncbi:Ran GTPase binding protein Sbp1 [Cryptotrichosporon argae]